MRDHFSLDLYSILIFWEFIMSVRGNQSWMRVKNVFCFPKWNISPSPILTSFLYVQENIFQVALSQSQIVLHLNMEKKVFFFPHSSASPKFVLHTLWQRRKCFAPNFAKKKKVNSKPCGELESRRPPVILLWQSKRWGNTECLDGAQIDESHAFTQHSITEQHLMLHTNFFTNFTVTNFFSLGVNISPLFALSFLHNTLSFPLILKPYLSHVNVVAIRGIMVEIVDIILKVIMLLVMIVVMIIAKKTESEGR